MYFKHTFRVFKDYARVSMQGSPAHLQWPVRSVYEQRTLWKWGKAHRLGEGVLGPAPGFPILTLQLLWTWCTTSHSSLKCAPTLHLGKALYFPCAPHPQLNTNHVFSGYIFRGRLLLERQEFIHTKQVLLPFLYLSVKSMVHNVNKILEVSGSQSVVPPWICSISIPLGTCQ